VPSGATTEKDNDRCIDMLKGFASEGKIDFIREVATERTRAIVMLRNMHTGKGLVVSPEDAWELIPAWRDFLVKQQELRRRDKRNRKAGLKDRTTKKMDQAFNHFVRVMDLKNPTLKEAIDVMEAYKEHSEASEWNHLRDYLSSFIGKVCAGRKHSPLWHAIRAIEGRPTRWRAKHPCTGDESRVIAEQLFRGRHPVAGWMWWSLDVTGMRPIEYWDGDRAKPGTANFSVPGPDVVLPWEPVYATHLHIRGEKRDASDRKIPRLYPEIEIVRPALTLNLFRACVNEAVAALMQEGKLAEPRVTLYDTRRTFHKIARDAKLTEPNYDHYTAHMPNTPGEKYPARVPPPEEIAADAKAMRKIFGPPPKAARANIRVVSA